MDSSLAHTVGQPSRSSPLAQRTENTLHPSGATGTLSPEPVPSENEQKTTGRTTSTSSTKVDASISAAPSRSATLKKNPSLRKRTSLSRRSSKRSLRGTDLKAFGEDGDPDDYNNVFHTPVPTTGNPTEILANRFQTWRKLLKDLITYFREIQTSYEHRSKALLKVSNVINNTNPPPIFMSQGGLADAITTLRGFHKVSLTEANKARDIEDDVITQLNGLRNDLNQKIKEIKSLSDDFKNSVEKKKENTRKAVVALQDALGSAESDPSPASAKSDPYIVRLGVDRQVELQIEEENYLHRAYLNLEGSGRELESIVVGEIQKAYNAYVGILRREADHAHDTIDSLRSGPIAMAKDHEWANFVEQDVHFVNPKIPLRQLGDIFYPGKFNPSATELRSGMLERKSKYLKSYTPGWYVLSPSYLYEFKSGDHLHTQTPVMSLFLLDQKLGSHSQPDATSHKFSFKGRQSGAMHRGHSWVFRAESYDTMMAWYEAIKILTETTTAERNAYVRKHARSVSGGTHQAPSVSSDGFEEDEADTEPYSGNLPRDEAVQTPVKRPEPGGRFPSDVDVNRGLQAPLSPSSNGSTENKDTPINPNSETLNGSQVSRSNQIEAVDRHDHYAGATKAASATVKRTDATGANGVIAEPKTSTAPSHPLIAVTEASTYDESSAPKSETHELPATSSPPTKPTVGSTSNNSGEALPGNSIPDTAAEGSGVVPVALAAGLGIRADQGETPATAVKIDGLAKDGAAPAETTLQPAAIPIASAIEAALGSSTNSSTSTLTTQKVAAMTSTGTNVPSVPRNDTSTSASELYVPGGFPPTPTAEE